MTRRTTARGKPLASTGSAVGGTNGGAEGSVCRRLGGERESYRRPSHGRTALDAALQHAARPDAEPTLTLTLPASPPTLYDPAPSAFAAPPPAQSQIKQRLLVHLPRLAHPEGDRGRPAHLQAPPRDPRRRVRSSPLGQRIPFTVSFERSFAKLLQLVAAARGIRRPPRHRTQPRGRASPRLPVHQR